MGMKITYHEQTGIPEETVDADDFTQDGDFFVLWKTTDARDTKKRVLAVQKRNVARIEKV